MFICIHASGLPFNGNTIPSGESLGGSESAAYYMAKELAALGHKVYCFTNSKHSGVWDDVNYEWIGQVSNDHPMGDRFDFVMQTPFDVLICQRHPQAFAKRYNTKLNIWWLHDLGLKRFVGMAQPSLVNIDKMFTVSEFHRQQVSEVFGIDAKHIIATKNGVDYTQFEGVDEFIREPGSLVFGSRPERGLAELVDVGGIMEQLPDCHLYVCGYDNNTQHMEAFYKYLWGRCEEMPNVTNLGSLGKRDLYERFARSMLYVYPTKFEDTSNIVAMESNAAGTPFLSFQNAALPETIGNDGAILLPFKDGQVDQPAFVKTVKDLMTDKAKWENLHKKAMTKYQSWSDIAKEWSGTFANLLYKKARTPSARTGLTRLAQHLVKHSDIVALNHLYDNDVEEITRAIPDYKENYDFYITGDYAGYYERYYEYEKNRGVAYGPENMTGVPRFESIADKVKQLKPKSILDYGCAHGPITMNLADRFRDIQYVGYDINPSNIEKAEAWSEKDGACAVFKVGTHLDVVGEYDCILITEVLEHVPNPQEVVEELRKHLTPGGTMVIGTPYGPWESIGYDDHPGWRAHIHHFERADLFEMFGKQPEYTIVALPNKNEFGHFMVTFKNSDEPIGLIDYDRKLREQAPRETVSLCMIVKNGEMTLPRTLSQIKPHVDEIIIGIDNTTDDDTASVAERFGAKVISIESPIEIGFDDARNATIEQATSDWIMWIDDDETLEYPDQLQYYLRPNYYDGYGVQQHHYATEPAALFKTDLPIRLFRNAPDVHFKGFVHEHPTKDKDINEGVGRIWVLPEVSIMHTGYATEAIRRLRFKRNWPLIQKDHLKYPDRHLGKMLWVRDVAHMIKYELERTGGQPFANMHGMAQEIIAGWLELIDLNASRMVVETLPYYSEAVSVLGQGGLYFAFAHDMIMGGNGNRPNPQAQQISGLFQSGDHIRKLTTMLIDESAKRYEGKYV